MMMGSFSRKVRTVLGVFESWSGLARAQGARDAIVRDFHRLYYDSAADGGTWNDTSWLGRPVLKTPLDLWSYQEIIVATIPELIIETGTYKGGSALFLATVCEALGHGRVVSIDVERAADPPSHMRLEFWTGSSVDPAIVARAAQAAAAARGVLVILDSDHDERHVLAELRAYSPMVPVGGWLIVEDTNVNGHPVLGAHGPGPMEAVRRFLAEDPRFEADERRAGKFLLTFNPGGYLRRVR